jgi:hypothetical protein
MTGDDEWQENQILYADDTKLVADEECKFQRLVSEFGRMCEKKQLSANVAKSKVIRVTLEGRMSVTLISH